MTHYLPARALLRAVEPRLPVRYATREADGTTVTGWPPASDALSFLTPLPGSDQGSCRMLKVAVVITVAYPFLRACRTTLAGEETL